MPWGLFFAVMSMQRVLLGIAVLVMATASCATKQKKGAAIGAGAGAATGAVVGGMVGGGKGALAGAGLGGAAGAITGAIIGDYMDKQEKALRKNVKSAEIERRGDRPFLVWKSQILFDVDRAALKSGAERDLAELAEVLTEYPETDLVIEGHTDSTGTAAYNEELSMRRARSVTDFLETRGVVAGRLTPRALGEKQPVAGNDTAAGRQLNRRVEVEIKPNDTLKKLDAEAAGKGRRG
jgi:outer membrane protein OmpA-like peptidoglycan-associated protein